MNGQEYFRPLAPLYFFKCRKTATGYFGLEEFGLMVPFSHQNNGHFDHKLSSKHTVESYSCYYQWYLNNSAIQVALCTQKRTEFHCPICEKGQREVFQPKLVIFRAEPSIDAPIRTCLPKIQACLDVFLANHPRPFQWPFGVQWTVIFRRKGFAQPGNWTRDLPLSVQML